MLRCIRCQARGDDLASSPVNAPVGSGPLWDPASRPMTPCLVPCARLRGASAFMGVAGTVPVRLRQLLGTDGS